MPTFRHVSKYEPLKEIPDDTTELICEFNGLEKLPALPETLTELDCAHNLLKELPSLPHLEKLVCDVNHLTTLPKLPESLNILKCSDNRLHKLPKLPHNLKRLQCSSNPLGSLPVLPDSLRELSCVGCGLTELPKLPDTLLTLTCNHNNLRTLPLLPESLKTIHTHNNPWEEPFLSYINKSQRDTQKLKKLLKEHYALEAMVRNMTAHNLTVGANKPNNPLPKDVTNHIRSFLMSPGGTTGRGIGRTRSQQRQVLKSAFAALKKGGGTRKALSKQGRRTRRN